MKKILRIFIIFISLFLFSSCLKQLELIGKNEVEVGEKITLTHNYDKSLEEIWISSNEDVAIVNNGIVKGLKEGNTTITLKIKDKEISKSILVKPSSIKIEINGKNILLEEEQVSFSAKISKNVNDKIVWLSSNKDIIDINDEGLVLAKKNGEAIISASIYGVKEEFKVKVLPKAYKMEIKGVHYLKTFEEYNFKIDDNYDGEIKIKWSVNDSTYASIDENGLVKAMKIGEVEIKASVIGKEELYATFNLIITECAPNAIELSIKNEIVQGIQVEIQIEIIGEECSKEVIWSSSNKKVAIIDNGLILPISAGKSTIKAQSILNDSIYGTLEITVKKFENEKINSNDLIRVNEIINQMTLKQKIGQMFIVGFNGTSMPDSLKKDIENYNFGNIIYMGRNVIDYKSLTKMTNNIQLEMVKNNLVPGFFATDQEGGIVARLTEGGTHFISNMAMAATNNPNNTYLEGKAMGKELSSYGINVDLAPVLDVNNNSENPVIGVRSYGDNAFYVSNYGNNMIKGLKEAGVMACSKHFPGHGNTNVDSHSGLPTITSSIDELYEIELAPFISAISNGIDSIMTSHIVFSAIDKDNPATLSKKVLVDLLRNELHFEGVIFTDGMGMGALQSFGTTGELAFKAINAGVDILTYTSIESGKVAFDAILEAVNNNEISLERIEESVRRILLKKLKYGILDNYIQEEKDISNFLLEHEELNNKFAMESLTLLKGKFKGLDKNKSTLIISPTTSYSIGNDLVSNSFACYASNYLLEQGFIKVDYKTTSSNITDYQKQEIMNIIDNYEQIVLATSNVKIYDYNRTASFVNEVVQKNKELLVVAINSPYDLLKYEGVENYVCTYGYQKASVIALSKYLNGEFEALGVSPINEELFN